MKLSWLVLLGACWNANAADGGEFFETNVRPVLVRQCLPCHSSPTSPMGGLRLDSREAMLKGGTRGAAIVPGKPAESLLLRAVRQSESLKMPPSGKLKDAEIAAIAQWIEMGAPWAAVQTAQAAGQPKKYWAFVPPNPPRPPDVKNAAWVQSPIDRFVLAALEAKGLAPAAPADKRTLIRRASYDLTGLPPSPEEVRAFLEDTRTDAFARVIDRLLASPRYGERWGRHWLDVARYADSNGLDENLVYRHACRYRDYVIQAFNQDKPYDLFLKEQLAGDLLPGPVSDAVQLRTLDGDRLPVAGREDAGRGRPGEDGDGHRRRAAGYHGATFMGLTVACARCHDHKFDPIPQADYYSLAGIFKSSKTMENFKVVAQWHEYVLAPAEEREKLKEHKAKIEAKNKEMGRISTAENQALVTEARTKIGNYLLGAEDVLRYERIPLLPLKTRQAQRAAASFDGERATHAGKRKAECA